MPRLPRPERRSPADWREQSSYSMYPNPRSRFWISSFDVLISSGRIFLVSFSSMWITNSSIDSYPAASEHCLTFSSSSPSIFTLCEPNIDFSRFQAFVGGAPGVSPPGWTGEAPVAPSYVKALTLLKHRVPHHI